MKTSSIKPIPIVFVILTVFRIPNLANVSGVAKGHSKIVNPINPNPLSIKIPILINEFVVTSIIAENNIKPTERNMPV